tara:strand:- start:454 stop:1188 length:735 start_codon:yes stop_codon:yes gene_type:complete
MESGMMSDISHLSSNSSSEPEWEIPSAAEQALSLEDISRVTGELSLRRTPMSDGAIDLYIRENRSHLRDEHKAGIRICYTGRVPSEGQQKQKKVGYYTIKEFLRMGNDMLDDPSFRWLASEVKPEYDDEYQTQIDLEALIQALGASICSDNADNVDTMSCKMCEDVAKDGQLTSSARERRMDQEERREVRAVRRENRRLLRDEIRRGVPGARTHQVAERRRRETERAARRARRTNRTRRGSRRS